MVLSGIENVLSTESDIKVVISTTSIDDLIAAVRRLEISVVLISTTPAAVDPLTALRAFRTASVDAIRVPKIVLIADELDAQIAMAAIKLGVRGTVLKHMPVHLLPKCVRKVAGGGRWIESQSHVSALDHLLAAADGPRNTHGLSNRESQILRLVADGRKNREIASSLEIAEGTVKTHVHNLCSKLNVQSRVGLARYAMTNALG
jgi:DNA-binding NarL/FixJ family response regulator